MRHVLLRFLSAALLIGLAPLTAAAVPVPLDIEFDNAAPGNYGTVDISENAGDLDFAITLDASLGSNRDLQEFYFNLVGAFSGLAISTGDMPNTPYELEADPNVLGGAGSSFDYGVNFGNGGGPPGNGRLMMATFTLSADQPLTLADLLEASMASGGSITIDIAAHVQGTSLFPGVDSEAVGGVIPIPEPATAMLIFMGAGVIALNAREKRARP